VRLPRRGPSRVGVRWILVGLPRRDRSDRLVLQHYKVRRCSPHVRLHSYVGPKSHQHTGDASAVELQQPAHRSKCRRCLAMALAADAPRDGLDRLRLQGTSGRRSAGLALRGPVHQVSVAPRPRTLGPLQCRFAVVLAATPSQASHLLPPPPHLSALHHVRLHTRRPLSRAVHPTCRLRGHLCGPLLLLGRGMANPPGKKEGLVRQAARSQ
jgi:hypothetical protein